MLTSFAVAPNMLCSTGRLRKLLEHVAGIKVINPVFHRTHSTRNYLPHSAAVWPQTVPARIRMQKIVHEITSQASLFYWSQRHTLSLLHFENQPLPVLSPRMMLSCSMVPQTLRRKKPFAAELTNHRSLNHSSPFLISDLREMRHCWRVHHRSRHISAFNSNQIESLARSKTRSRSKLQAPKKHCQQLHML